MQKDDRKAVFNLKEAAAYLAMLLRSGKIPCRRAGKRWLIPRSALDTWLINNI